MEQDRIYQYEWHMGQQTSEKNVAGHKHKSACEAAIGGQLMGLKMSSVRGHCLIVAHIEDESGFLSGLPRASSKVF